VRLAGQPDWSARGRGVDHVLTVAGLKRVERADRRHGHDRARSLRPRHPAAAGNATTRSRTGSVSPAPLVLEPISPKPEALDPRPPLEIQRFGRRWREAAQPDGA
jgi:hypothetical protein